MKKIVKNGNRYCPFCGHLLQRKGRYKFKASHRWYCPKCHKYARFNKDQGRKRKNKLWLFKYFEYLTHSKRMSEYGCHRTTFWRNTKIFKNKNIFIPESNERHLVIYLDGLRVNKKTYLIASDGKYVIGFGLADYESSNNWKNFLKNFCQPQYVVYDGQNGLIRAIKSLWFNTKIQRCLFYVWMNVKQKLTMNPETQAGQELLSLSKKLLTIKSIDQASDWQNNFKTWKDKYHNFINEKSINPEIGEVWFTHARLRSAAFNLNKLILNKTLFNFLENNEVKSMNNVLESGINSPIRHLLNCHRGTNFVGQQKIVEIYLLKRSMFWSKILVMISSKKCSLFATQLKLLY